MECVTSHEEWVHSRDDPIRLSWGDLNRMTPLVQRWCNVEDMQHRRDDDEQSRLSEVPAGTYPAPRFSNLLHSLVTTQLGLDPPPPKTKRERRRVASRYVQLAISDEALRTELVRVLENGGVVHAGPASERAAHISPGPICHPPDRRHGVLP